MFPLQLPLYWTQAQVVHFICTTTVLHGHGSEDARIGLHRAWSEEFISQDLWRKPRIKWWILESFSKVMAEKENSEVGWQVWTYHQIFMQWTMVTMDVCGRYSYGIRELPWGHFFSQLKPGGHHLGWECPSSMEDGAMTSNHLPSGYD